jgi:hypothetical protein
VLARRPGERNHNTYNQGKQSPLRKYYPPLTQEEVFIVKIKRYKPPISLTAKPFRAVRRLHRNPTYIPIRIGPVMNGAVLAALSATAAMSGLILGFCMRIAGL